MTWVQLNLLKGKSHWGGYHSLRLHLVFEEDFEIKFMVRLGGTGWHLNDTVEFVPSIWLSGSV